jgi:ribosomal protein S1
VQEEEAILSINGKLRAKTEARKEDEALLDLRRSQAGAILTGTVSSVESFRGSMGGAVAVVYHEGYKIVIPAKLFKGFPPYDQSLGYENEEHMHLAIMRKHLMAEIDFKIHQHPQSINTTEKVAIASRIDAMKIKRNKYWIEKNKHGKTIIHNGSIVEARVINVPYTCAIVEIQGVEFKIPKMELSHMMVKDAGAVVKPGDIILVYVDDIKIDEQGRVTAFVSHKKTQTNPQERALVHLSEHSMCVGKVTAMTASSIYVVLEQGAEIRCNPPAMVRLPAVGDQVRVKILYIDMPKLRATGEIFNVL